MKTIKTTKKDFETELLELESRILDALEKCDKDLILSQISYAHCFRNIETFEEVDRENKKDMDYLYNIENVECLIPVENFPELDDNVEVLHFTDCVVYNNDQIYVIDAELYRNQNDSIDEERLSACIELNRSKIGDYENFLNI